MKKNKFILIVTVIFFFSFLIGCDNSNNEKPVRLGSQNVSKYGRKYTQSGIETYVDENGIFSTKVVENGYTMMKIEISKSSTTSSKFVGFDSSKYNLPEGSFFRVQPINLNNNKELYDQYYDMLDKNDLRYKYEFIDFLHIWIEDSEGNEIKIFEPKMNWLIEKSEEDYLKIVSVENDIDEELINSFTQVTNDLINARFISIETSHSCEAIAFLEEA